MIAPSVKNAGSDVKNAGHMTTTAYDEVRYSNFPYAQTHPDRLATVAILAVLKALFGSLRVTDEAEFDGLDLSEHSESAYNLATSGGARALGKSAAIGSLDVGKEADLLLVDLAALLPYRKEGARLDDLSTEDILALCIYRGNPEATLETYVRGRCVYRAPHWPQSQ